MKHNAPGWGRGAGCSDPGAPGFKAQLRLHSRVQLPADAHSGRWQLMAQVVRSLPPWGKTVFSPSQPQLLWATGEWWGDLFLSPSLCLSKQTAQTGKEVGTVEPPAPQGGKQNGTQWGRRLLPSLHMASPRDSATPRLDVLPETGRPGVKTRPCRRALTAAPLTKEASPAPGD